jgi:hypothetical protein
MEDLLNRLLDRAISMQSIPWILSLSLISVIVFWLKNPDRFEAFLALVNRLLIRFVRGSEYRFVKWDIQSRLNKYIRIARSKVDHISSSTARIHWVNTETDQETFIRNGVIVFRMRKSTNQNKNLVTACVAFISTDFLKSAKAYLAKYQRDALDMYVCHDILAKETRDIVQVFVDDYLRDSLDGNDKLRDLFDSFIDIDRASLFYPVLVQELVYLGQKVFSKKRDSEAVHREVSQLTTFLKQRALRRVGDDSVPSQYIGAYCSFGVVIVGKSSVIERSGERAYVNFLKGLGNKLESIYLIGNLDNRRVMRKVTGAFCEDGGYSICRTQQFSAVIHDPGDKEVRVRNFLILLRRDHIESLRR